MLLNIELKGPTEEASAAKYNFELTAKKVVELIEHYDIGRKVMVSSFTPKILDGIAKASPNASTRQFII